jgi:hypothetical protein
MSALYKIVRFCFNAGPEDVEGKGGLTLAEAQEHCNDPSTRGDGWFEGYTRDDASASDPDVWEVIVGNVGTVYRGPHPVTARLEYNMSVALAGRPFGRYSGESVDLWKNGEPVASTPSTLGSIEEEEEGVNGNWEVYS